MAQEYVIFHAKYDGDPVDIRIFHSGNWSALYVDGKHVTSGDTDLTWEKLTDLLGIPEVSVADTDTLFPGGGRNAPTTLEELEIRLADEAAREEIQRRALEQAEELEEQARQLRDQAWKR